MPRSKWKIPFLKFGKNLNEKKRIVSRNSEILPNFINHIFYIHDGKQLNKIEVTENLVGHKFGEFVNTRKKFIFKVKK